MILSQTAEYALRAVLAIAREADGKAVGAARIAAELGIPANYLSKTLHQLARAGILESARGKLGGFRLARAGDRITHIDGVSAYGITNEEVFEKLRGEKGSSVRVTITASARAIPASGSRSLPKGTMRASAGSSDPSHNSRLRSRANRRC